MSRRVQPEFFLKWRNEMVPYDPDRSPLDYLLNEDSLPFVVITQWLFAPELLEYHGCVLVVDDSSAVPPSVLSNVDNWIRVLGGDISAVERKVNLLDVSDLFAMCDPSAHHEELSELARSVGRCWRALAAAEFPDRQFQVAVDDDLDAVAGPTVTMFTQGPRHQAY